MNRDEERRPPGAEKPRWARRLLAGTRAAILLLVGVLVGSASLGRDEREVVLVDVYWRDSLAEELQFVGTTSIDTAAGEEFRVRGELGREAVLLFCSPRSERNPCGAEGLGPKARPEPGGEFPARESSGRGRRTV